MDFSGRLREMIAAKGWTQAQAAEAAGVPARTLIGWLTKGQMPNVAQAVKIARALDVTAEYLVDGEEGSLSIASAITRSSHLEHIVWRLRKCSQTDLARVLLGLDAILGPEDPARAPDVPTLRHPGPAGPPTAEDIDIATVHADDGAEQTFAPAPSPRRIIVRR